MPFLDREITVAQGASCSASEFKNRRIKLRTLVERLGQFPPGQKDGPAVLQGELQGTQRKASELRACHLLMFDIDEGGDFDSICASLRTAGLFGVVWNTFSHAPDAPRIRALLVLAEPFTFPGDGDGPQHAAQRALWSKLYMQVANQLGITADPACKDCSRLFYLPRRPMNSRAEDFRCEMIEGGPIDLEQFEVVEPPVATSHDWYIGTSETLDAPSLDVVVNALTHIPSDDREVWLAVGMGLHHSYGESGFLPWSTWSESSSKFDAEDQQRTWESFKRDKKRSVTWKMVLSIAGKHGWKPPRQAGNDAEVIDRLARMGTLDYDRARKQAATELAVSLSTLDREVRIRRREIENEDDRPAFARDPEPYSEAVDGLTLLDELVACIKRYAVLPAYGAEAAALWVLHAHAHDASQISPLLAFESPVKRCGKTTTMMLLTDLVPRPLASSGPSAAAIYRAVERYKPTLILDEADTYLEENESMRGVLNAGHNRRFANIIRVEGENLEVREFSAWGPKIIGCIGLLPDTLQDRSIVIRMRRKLGHERVERLRADRADDRLRLQAMAWRWAQDNLDQLRIRNPDMPAAINDRAQDNWRALVAIADQIGGVWPDMARQIALNISGQAEAETSEPIEIQLLRDIQEIFNATGASHFKPDELLANLWAIEDSPWLTFSNRRPLTRHKLARMLDRFEIENGQRRIDGAKSRFYVRSAFIEAFSRYLSGDSRNQIGTIGTGDDLCRYINDLVGVPICENEHSAPSKSGQLKHQIYQDVMPDVPIVPISNPERGKRERIDWDDALGLDAAMTERLT